MNPCDYSAEISAEYKKLSKIFSSVEENKKNFVKSQIKSMAWYVVMIEALQKSIEENGTTSAWNNGGGQTGFRENPDCKTLIAYQKIVTAITNQLIGLVPASEKKNKLVELMKNVPAS